MLPADLQVTTAGKVAELGPTPLVNPRRSAFANYGSRSSRLVRLGIAPYRSKGAKRRLSP
jgi:hypothetical protein